VGVQIFGRGWEKNGKEKKKKVMRERQKGDQKGERKKDQTTERGGFGRTKAE